MIKTTIQDSIGVITLSRPWVHNAVNIEMIEELGNTIIEWKYDPDVNVIVITGEGASFCSGADLEELYEVEEKHYKMILQLMNDVLYDLQTVPKLTVAALNGTAVGGGCEIATSCDFRVAHSNVKLGFINIKLGIMTGWGGATRLFELIPRSVALEWLCTGQIFYSTTGHQHGFIDKIFPEDQFLEHVFRWCGKMTDHSTHVLQAYKETALIHDDSSMSMKKKLDMEVERGIEMWNSIEHEVAVARFLQKK